MTYLNFQVGEKFPLPIRAAGDGGIFQYDCNGAMFILKLSRTDIVAAEAFRTGKIELALFAASNILFLLYQIEGIFSGWGDCPYAAQSLAPALRPDPERAADRTLNLYLVDSRLDLLLAQRRATLSDAFWRALLDQTRAQLAAPFCADGFAADARAVWEKYPPEEMARRALATQTLPLELPAAPRRNVSPNKR